MRGQARRPLAAPDGKAAAAVRPDRNPSPTVDVHAILTPAITNAKVNRGRWARPVWMWPNPPRSHWPCSAGEVRNSPTGKPNRERGGTGPQTVAATGQHKQRSTGATAIATARKNACRLLRFNAIPQPALCWATAQPPPPSRPATPAFASQRGGTAQTQCPATGAAPVWAKPTGLAAPRSYL